jgi:hypothetical protein
VGSSLFQVGKREEREQIWNSGIACLAGASHPLHQEMKSTRKFVTKEALIKSHRGRCGKNGPRARRLRGSIPAAGCNREANEASGLLSPQPNGLKAFVDFCRVARSGETAAGIAQHSRLQKSATVLQRPSWDLISVSLRTI